MIKESILTLEKAENGEAKIFNHNLGVSFFIKEGQKFGLKYEYDGREDLIKWAKSEIWWCKMRMIGLIDQNQGEARARIHCGEVIIQMLGEKYE